MRVVGRTQLSGGLHRHTVGLSLMGILLIFSIALPADGAVRRRLNVQSNPAGALVYVDNQQIGTTPCSVDFTYYGTREIRLIKPGFETLTVNQPIPAPWYEYVPLDFVSENLLFTKVRDNRTVTYNLAPQLIIPTPELLSRAVQLRQDTLPNPATQVGPTVPASNAPVPFAPPPISGPEPLPGINPQAVGPPALQQQPVPAPPPGAAPLLPPRF